MSILGKRCLFIQRTPAILQSITTGAGHPSRSFLFVYFSKLTRNYWNYGTFYIFLLFALYTEYSQKHVLFPQDFYSVSSQLMLAFIFVMSC